MPPELRDEPSGGGRTRNRTRIERRGRVERGGAIERALAAYLPAYALPAILGIAVIPILSRQLGTAQFGIYAVCLSIHGLLLPLGADPTSNAIRRLYAQVVVEGDAQRFLKAVLGLAFALAGGVALAALALTGALAPIVDLSGWIAPLAAVVLMTAAFTVFQYMLTILYVQERVRATATTQIAHSIGKSGALVGGAVALGSAFGSFVAYAGLLVLMVLWLLRYAARGYPFVDVGRWRRAARYGTPLIGVSLSFVVLAGFDRVTLAAVSGDSTAGQYGATYLLADGSISLVALVLTQAAYPTLVKLWEEGAGAATRDALRTTVDFFLIIGTTVLGILAIGGSALIETVSGRSFAVPDIVPVLIGLGLLLYQMGRFEAIGFELRLTSGRLAATFVAAAAACIPVTVVAVLVGGLTGAAVSTAVSYGIFWGLVRLRGEHAEITAHPSARLAAVALPLVMLVAAGRELPSYVIIPVIAVVQPLAGVLLLGHAARLRNAVRRVFAAR
jgi:O-antigen/teichoic acid export membrane protein